MKNTKSKKMKLILIKNSTCTRRGCILTMLPFFGIKKKKAA